MGAFPSPLEHSVAEALLLLSSSSSLSCNDESSSPGLSCSSSSNVTSDASSRTVAGPLRFLAMAAYYADRKLKMVRRSRSKMYRISDRQRILSAKKKEMEREIKEGSALSSSSISSSVSDGSSWNRVRIGKRYWKCDQVAPWKKTSVAESTRLRCRADAILKFLSEGCASEVRIRAVLGDSPDTSKALRMLLKLEEVKRSGAGGRADPFLYACPWAGQVWPNDFIPHCAGAAGYAAVSRPWPGNNFHFSGPGHGLDLYLVAGPSSDVDSV